MDQQDNITVVGTRTGTKAHLAFADSSVTFCGVWLRTNASHYELPADHPRKLCRNCFGDHAEVPVKPVPAQEPEKFEHAVEKEQWWKDQQAEKERDR